jgi:PKD repeat protein
LIRRQYFDDVAGNDVGSFAEYWREISYGDVTIGGNVTDWIDLPWAIQPPLVSAARDPATGNPPVNDNLANAALRNSPANFFDLNSSSFYEYGEPERFNNSLATTPIDWDGDPNDIDNGPDFVGPGSGHSTEAGDLSWPVWKPGERFVDMDEDGRWDGLDEATNLMDRSGGPQGGPDGRPDSLGPWIDLDGDGEPNNAGDCVYLRNSDNDEWPDCCPEGPFGPGCDRFPAEGACLPTQWDGPNNTEVIDCNGNLIPDACDISCTSPGCEAWISVCGGSQDRLPFTAQNGQCDAGDGDDVPDECQFQSPEEPCVDRVPNNCGKDDPNPDPCCDVGPCRELPEELRDPQARCEFSDINDDEEIDIVEPYENFMRRWDPCLFDPDVSAPNAQPRPQGHWVKVYDPLSRNASQPLICISPPSGTCSGDPRPCLGTSDCPAGQTCKHVTYGDPAYIRDNYPARDADQDDLIAQATGRPVYGPHDPLGKLDGVPCICSIPWPGSGTCSVDRRPCVTNADCVQGRTCQPSRECRDVALPDSYCSEPPCGIERACFVGYHSQFDPPDDWTNAQANNGPGNTAVATTKMRAAPGVDAEADFIEPDTPEPGNPPYPDCPGCSPSELNKLQWYPQAWQDRYGAECENPAYRDDQDESSTNRPTVTCTPPAWTRNIQGEGQTHEMAAFVDVNTTGYDPAVHRRYFKANRGGLHGDGTGWNGCGDRDAGVIFETGPLGDIGFEEACDRPILPEEAGGASRPAIFFDGWVEHDDLPSSKYHMAGDQRLGEVTSPYNNSIFGQDRGPHTAFAPPDADEVIAPAGPYAVHVHGNLGRDAGNVLLLELMTWRTRPPFNNGNAWQRNTRGNSFHPYAFLANKGFRDYNLDGLVDQGECRHAGSENYQHDSLTGTVNDGIASIYPFHRDRMVEDAVEVIDDLVDFDDFVDPVALEQVNCLPNREHPFACLPWQLEQTQESTRIDDPFNSLFACDEGVFPNGICSGIVLLPPGAHADGIFNRAPSFVPIHNEDNDDPSKKFPLDRNPSTNSIISWNLFFFDLVFSLGVEGEQTVPAQDFQTAFSAHEYLHSWEGFPDLYDYDVYQPEPRPVINCPIGRWDIMAGGGLVHPVPILKESTCTDWVEPVDLTTVLTPGVDGTITLPPAALVRDDSYYFLENEARPGERYYFWSAGFAGFDERMPGDGLLILHTDVGANPDSLPGNQTNSTRPTYLIVQADGLRELEAGEIVDPACGDTGDPWPGSANRRRFNFNTTPPATWYTQDSWTGIDILDVRPDGAGSVQIKMNWIPTSIPSLKFIDPPGGVSVGTAPNINYNVRAEATDVFGGTWLQFYYTTQTSQTPNPGTATPIRLVKKTTPGTNVLSTNWNIHGLANGRYFIFADLIPDQGADGRERNHSTPRPGRNNRGDTTLEVLDDDVLTSKVQGGQITVQGKARSETWTLRCINATTGEWIVNSSLTQPPPAADAPNQDPYPHAMTGQKYVSAAGGVSFTVKPGTGPFAKGAVGDTFAFATTGITALSEAVTIREGQIREDPTAIIIASPLAGLPPLKVTFDARASIDPNGQPLQFRWDFGDGTPVATGSQVEHTYNDAGTFAVVLRATNPANSRFGEATVNIEVTNNSPNAVIRATPTSGTGACPGAPGESRCLTVTFSAGQSSDTETDEENLIYQWDFGDGTSANDNALPGILREAVEHTYTRRADGSRCTVASPCTFTATLKVTDTGGKTDTDTVTIRVGNTNPVANVTTSCPGAGCPGLIGASPLTVIFNAKNSTDPENDPIEVEWIWGDGQANEKYTAKTGKPPATNGDVPHTFTLPAGVTTKTFAVKAILRDGKGGETNWPGVSITVTNIEPRPPQNRAPTAAFTTTPPVALVGEDVVFDAGTSADPDGDDVTYRWSFGDGSSMAFGANERVTHSYNQVGDYIVRLTVRDEFDASSDATRIIRVVLVGTNRAPVALIATGPRSGPAPLTLTFDGRISYDPDGNPIAYLWEFKEGDQVLETMQSSVVTRTFTGEGTFTVTLTVADGRGGQSTSEPETVVVSGAVPPPPVEPPPPQEVPEEPPPSESQRPPSMTTCGLGMIGALLVCMLGLTLTAVSRRRSRR